MDNLRLKSKKLTRRKLKIRGKIVAQKGKLRLCLSKSNKNFYAQIIDDEKRVTLFGMSTLSESCKDIKTKSSVEGAKLFGKIFAETAVSKGYKQVVFDRNGNLYHGKVKAFAEAARENGLEF